MSIWSKIQEIEKKSAWSLFGAIIGVASLFIGVYLWWLTNENNEPKLKFFIESKVDLLEIKDTINSLEIFVKGENIIESKKNIDIYTVTAENSGDHILQNHYDQSNTFALKFPNQTILSYKTLDTNESYLNLNFFDKIQNDLLIFNKVIFEKEKFITFNVYTIRSLSEDEFPKVLGKIAGNKGIDIEKRSIPEIITLSFLNQEVTFEMSYIILIFFSNLFISYLIFYLYIKMYLKRQAKERTDES